jgi:PDZ domain
VSLSLLTHNKTCFYRQGKLGIVIDTTLDGPVIHRVNDNSPLKGYIFPGDIIVAVNNTDTRAMSAQAITSLMGRTAQRRRMLTVLSTDMTSDNTAGAAPRSSGDSVVSEEEEEEETKQEIEPAMDPPVLMPIAGAPTRTGTTATGIVAGVGAAAAGIAAAVIAAASSKPTAVQEVEEAAAASEQQVVVAEETIAPAPVPVATSASSVAGSSERAASVRSEDDIATVTSSLRSEMQSRIIKAPPVRKFTLSLTSTRRLQVIVTVAGHSR